MTIPEILDLLDSLDGAGLVITDDDLLHETLVDMGFKEEVPVS